MAAHRAPGRALRYARGFTRGLLHHQPGHSPKEEKKRIKALERDLARKEKALAEAAALLVLRKNAAAIWGDGEDA